jgi:hypothetical protein
MVLGGKSGEGINIITLSHAHSLMGMVWAWFLVTFAEPHQMAWRSTEAADG